MFNTTFNSLDEAKKLNNMTDMQLVHHLKVYFANQNYRKDYNSKRNRLLQTLKNDPIVLKRAAELKSKLG